ncbi:MAG: hypothetical protein AB7O54_11330 [Pseudomonadales bacterium]
MEGERLVPSDRFDASTDLDRSENPFSDEGRYDGSWSAFFIIDRQYQMSEHLAGDLFCHYCGLNEAMLMPRLADYLRYEAAQNRNKIVACPPSIRHDDLIRQALEETPAQEFIRTTDPRWIIHSTTLDRGKRILSDGAIKSQQLLLEEGCLSDHQPGYVSFREPTDYLNHVNFGAITSPWAEAVVRSNQTGEFASFDQPYKPGIRFYVDAHKLIEDRRVLRVGAPHLKAEGLVLLQDYVVGWVSADDFPEHTEWTPISFTKAADELFLSLHRE